jgi:hypothetical protein
LLFVPCSHQQRTRLSSNLEKFADTLDDVTGAAGGKESIVVAESRMTDDVAKPVKEVTRDPAKDCKILSIL